MMTVDEKLDLLIGKVDSMETKIGTIDNRVGTIEDRLSTIEIKQDRTNKKLEDLSTEVKASELNIMREIRLLKDAEDTLVTVLERRGLLPLGAAI